jgi:L-asparaginase II
MTVTAVRGGVEESRHQVHVAVADVAGRLVAWHGDPHRLTTMRSAAKPFQAQPLVASGGLEALGIDTQTLAVSCASHQGLDEQVAAVQRGLDACGLTADALQNLAGTPQQRLRHNCSGNHLAFLALSVHRGWDVAGYRHPDHPSQRAALEQIALASGVSQQHIGTCTDGCGVVCFALPLVTIAAMYARLPQLLPRQLAPMRRHPGKEAGPGDIDSELPPVVPGSVAKGGAEGLGCVALGEQGLGIALRVEDGAYRAVEPALIDVLAQLMGWAAPPPELATFRVPEIRNSPGDVVGFLRADIPLTRA